DLRRHRAWDERLSPEYGREPGEDAWPGFQPAGDACAGPKRRLPRGGIPAFARAGGARLGGRRLPARRPRKPGSPPLPLRRGDRTLLRRPLPSPAPGADLRGARDLTPP